ncbi:phosphatase PAP2 family protein [Ottowia sp.]|uniref:phosphatase PAP2 family protein n=1 Tax=Ottowia sp. TaxID=1898956 RepID=UPI0039E34E35
MSQARPTSWLSEAWRRIRKLAWLKALGNVVFLIVFFQLYLAIQQHPAQTVIQIPATSIDHWVGFQPWAVGLYLSLWVYTALPVALQPDLRSLAFYGWTIGLLCAVGLTIFYLAPTSVSVAAGQRPEGGALFATLYAVDDNGNACPSLHVAAAVLSGLWLHHMLRRLGAPRWAMLANQGWCAGIVFSTMAIKQHLLIDVLAGGALGAVAGWWSLRTSATRLDTGRSARIDARKD